MFLNNEKLIHRFEEITRNNYDKIIRLKGYIKDINNRNEEIELIIFRGFTSSTTHTTEYNCDESTLPSRAEIKSAEILQGPINPYKVKILVGPCHPRELLKNKYWMH